MLSMRCSSPGKSSGRDQETLRVIAGAVDVDLVAAGETRVPVQGVDAAARQVGFHAPGDRVGEAVFVRHQVRPVDRQPRVINALSVHKSGAVDDLGPASQDLLRIAPAQRARSAIGKGVDDRDPPTVGGALLRGGDAGHARADDDQIVGLVHEWSFRKVGSKIRSCIGHDRSELIEGGRSGIPVRSRIHAARQPYRRAGLGEDIDAVDLDAGRSEEPDLFGLLRCPDQLASYRDVGAFESQQP